MFGLVRLGRGSFICSVFGLFNLVWHVIFDHGWCYLIWLGLVYFVIALD